MRKGSKKNAEIDELLRKALADDLPADVEAAMRPRIATFRAAKMADVAAVHGRHAASRAWLFRRAVWAALSILLLVAGIFLQGERASSPLADRISAIKTQYPGLEMPRR